MENPAAIPGPLSDAQRAELVEIEASGVLPLNFNPRALRASVVVKTTQGKLYGLTVTSTNANAQFIQVFDAASLPADTSVPLFTLNVAANSPVGLYYGSVGRAFEQGIVICNSSTQGTKTIGSADCLFDVQYI